MSAGVAGAAGAAATLPPPRLHLPFEDGPYRMTMGLTAAPLSEWVEIDARYPAEMAQRRRLIEHRGPDVLAAESGSEPMQQELLELLETHLTGRYPAWFATAEGAFLNRLTDESWGPAERPLERVGWLVQEDFCLLDVTGASPVLVAAVLCFPSRWVLAEKIGRPLGPIHARVPFYPERLQRPVDRFLAVLKQGLLATRLNWSVTDDPALFQQHGKFAEGLNTAITPENAGERTWLRVERQTLRRLPRSGGVAFGIRVHVDPLHRVAVQPGEAARLHRAVAALPADMARYKSLLPYREALLAYLAAAADRPAVS